MRAATRVCRLAAACLVGLHAAGGSATAQEASPVYVPVTFHAEGGQLKTSACLQVGEHRHPDSRWWETTAPLPPAADAFRSVVAAMKAGDRAALSRVSAKAQADSGADFVQQAAAYFDQIRKYDIAAVRLAYEVDRTYVFFAELKAAAGRNAFAPFAFEAENGSFRFLPNRTSLPTAYQLVRDWFSAPWGPGGGNGTSYCEPSDIKSATHRVILDGSSRWGALLLRGASIDTTGALRELASRVVAKDAAMKVASRKGADAVMQEMTPEGARQLARWVSSASETERQNYLQAIERSRSFFFFNLASVIVVYTKAADGVQVMYFTFTPDKQLQWTNAARATLADSVFKRGALLSAAQSFTPFASVQAGAAK